MSESPLIVGTEGVSGPPLTVGTAGHIDHGKTAIVITLTGIDTDRLPEERARGMTIVLGYAPLQLPSGRRLSLVDVPGHERLVRVMVAGATGIDLFLLVVAADDGVMPQTVEHARVLAALGVRRGVVVVTKADLADPEPTMKSVRSLVPDGVEMVACSARTGAGVAQLAAALDRVAAACRGGARSTEPAVMHVDRVFSVHGVGTVVTGTLWWGTIGRGDRLTVLPAGHPVRVRGVQVHDRACDRAGAGQRVAVNLTGVSRQAVSRGDVLAAECADLRVAYRVEAELQLDEPLENRERVQVHHGTRWAPARAVRLDGSRWQLRCERPLIAADGDRLVIRRINPPGTVGGGVLVRARTHKPAPAPPPQAATKPAPALTEAALELERRLGAAGHEPPNDAVLGELAGELPALVAAGRAVRIGRSMHAHPEAIAVVRAVLERLIERDGAATLASLRDELGTSRKYAQALLEHFDATRVTRRLEDNSRVLRPRRSNSGNRGSRRD